MVDTSEGRSGMEWRRGFWQGWCGWSVLFASGCALVLAPRVAHAVPSFARQTGLACSSCHTTFPELTAFGRMFKMHGYTTLGAKEFEEAGTDQAPPMTINRTFPLSLMQIGR